MAGDADSTSTSSTTALAASSTSILAVASYTCSSILASLGAQATGSVEEAFFVHDDDGFPAPPAVASSPTPPTVASTASASPLPFPTLVHAGSAPSPPEVVAEYEESFERWVAFHIARGFEAASLHVDNAAAADGASSVEA